MFTSVVTQASLNKQASTIFQLWSAGNVRIQKLDLTIPAVDAVELVDALKEDSRVSSPHTS
jgi:hypothetical protein